MPLSRLLNKFYRTSAATPPLKTKTGEQPKMGINTVKSTFEVGPQSTSHTKRPSETSTSSPLPKIDQPTFYNDKHVKQANKRVSVLDTNKEQTEPFKDVEIDHAAVEKRELNKKLQRLMRANFNPELKQLDKIINISQDEKNTDNTSRESLLSNLLSAIKRYTYDAVIPLQENNTNYWGSSLDLGLSSYDREKPKTNKENNAADAATSSFSNYSEYNVFKKVLESAKQDLMANLDKLSKNVDLINLGCDQANKGEIPEINNRRLALIEFIKEKIKTIETVLTNIEVHKNEITSILNERQAQNALSTFNGAFNIEDYTKYFDLTKTPSFNTNRAKNLTPIDAKKVEDLQKVFERELNKRDIKHKSNEGYIKPIRDGFRIICLQLKLGMISLQDVCAYYNSIVYDAVDARNESIEYGTVKQLPHESDQDFAKRTNQNNIFNHNSSIIKKIFMKAIGDGVITDEVTQNPVNKICLQDHTQFPHLPTSERERETLQNHQRKIIDPVNNVNENIDQKIAALQEKQSLHEFYLNGIDTLFSTFSDKDMKLISNKGRINSKTMIEMVDECCQFVHDNYSKKNLMLKDTKDSSITLADLLSNKSNLPVAKNSDISTSKKKSVSSQPKDLQDNKKPKIKLRDDDLKI